MISLTDLEKSAIDQWATDYCQHVAATRAAGVLLGGSIARGDQWKHSDLELGLLVDEADSTIPYFNVDSGRGVEIIQLVTPQLAADFAVIDAGDVAPIATWPIQMYRARVISDPCQLLGRFVELFDQHLFSDTVVRRKLTMHLDAARRELATAQARLADGQPRAALSAVRLAMNELFLALFWTLRELPRSQSRAESRLRDLCTRHDRMPFHALYRDVFDLDSADAGIAQDWPQVKERVLTLAELWGAREFFVAAVDSDFSWGENDGILCVHRLYIPVLGSPNAGILGQLDDQDWAAANADMIRFLGFEHATTNRVAALLNRVAQTADALAADSDR